MTTSAETAPDFHVRLFGGPVILRDGEAVPLSTYQSALLAVVFGSGVRGTTRGEVIGLLWSDGDERTRRRRLSQLLYSLAQKAPPGPIAVEGEKLSPEPGRTTSDLLEFQDALGRGEVRKAAELARDEFLGDLSGFVTDAFSDWVEGKRLRARRELRERASSLWSEARAEARWARAVDAAEILLEIDPLDEEALRRVVLGRAMSGALAEARAAALAFEERARLQSEEWVPEQETRQLLDRIEAIGEETRGQEKAGPIAEPPLCGRVKELATLSRVVTKPDHGGLALVTVLGEGGMGKTRLVQEALTGAHFQKIRVLTARSSEFEKAIPLNPILEALARPDVGEILGELEDPWRRVLLGLMPELHKGPGPLPEIPYIRPGSLPRRLFEAIRQIFLAVTEQGPVVLFLDDFQWADDTSIAALEYLRRRWEGGSLCVVLAVRPEDVERGGSAARFIDTLGPMEEATDIELRDLNDQDVHELISALAEDALTQAQSRRIAALSGNNPFFVIELTLEVLAGREIPGGDITILTPVPVSIRQLLAHRLSGLSKQAEQLLGLIVVFGRVLAGEDLRKLSELSGKEFVESLEELHKLRLVNRTSKGKMGARHELIRQTVYGRLSETRRSFIHERVARFLLGSRESPPVDEVALHFDRAGVRDEAHRFSLEAANAAEVSGAVPEALRFLGVARRNTDDDAASTEILWRLAHLHYLHRNLSEAAPLLELATNRLRAQDRIQEALKAEAEKLDTLASLGSIPEEDLLAEIHRLKDRAIERSNWEVVAMLMDTAIHIHHRSNDHWAVRRCLAEIEGYLGRGDEEAECLMLSSLVAHVPYGQPAKGVTLAKAGLEIAERLGRKDLWLKAANRYLFAIINHGTFNCANGIELSRKAQEEARLSGDLMTRYRLHANLGVWYLDIGSFEEALIEFTKAMNTLRATEAPHARLNVYYNIGEAHYFLNNVTAAEEHFRRTETAITSGTPGFYQELVDAGLGLCAFFNGDLVEANSREQRLSFDRSEWNFNPLLLIIFKERMLVRRGQRREVFELLERQSAILETHLPVPALQLKIRLLKILKQFGLKSGRQQQLRQNILNIVADRQLHEIAKRIHNLPFFN